MTVSLAGFGCCEICGNDSWSEVYRGRVRDGSVGRFKDNGVVAECGGCGVQRLIEDCVIPDSYYATDQYRASLEQNVDSDKAYAEQDWSTRYTHEALWPRSLRGLVIADVGCGVGSFLDTCKGQAGQLIAVEPCEPFQPSLQSRGYTVFGSAAEAARAVPDSVDIAVSIQVIEHVSDPVGFLRDIRPLLQSKDGTLVITTPNRKDILGSLHPDAFLEFFYRSAHRWYFDADSLARCAEKAGYRVERSATLQKYGMSNMLQWLRDGRPKGFTPLAHIGPAADSFWKGYLEQIGCADTLVLTLRPAVEGE